MQLELFSADRELLAEGWALVERLDLERAREVFEEVASRWPDSGEAVEALELVASVRRGLGDLEAATAPARIERLWAVGRRLPDRGLASRFRRAVLERLVVEMDAEGAGGPEREPCRGEVLLAVGRIREAERWLRAALGDGGVPPRLLRLHGEALWTLGRRREARLQWLRWLLALGPEAGASAAAGLRDPALVEVVATTGVGGAALEAWFRDLTWLLPEDQLPSWGSRELRSHRLVAAAERARREGDLERAVRLRKRLLRSDPATLRRYLSRLEGTG